MSKWNTIHGNCKVCEGPLFLERLMFPYARITMLSCKMCGRKYDVVVERVYEKLKKGGVKQGKRTLTKRAKKDVERAMKRWMAEEGLTLEEAAEKLGYRTDWLKQVFKTKKFSSTFYERLHALVPCDYLRRI